MQKTEIYRQYIDRPIGSDYTTMPKDLFTPALEKLRTVGAAVLPPTSFRDYLDENGLQRVSTCSSISIDTYEQLPQELKENNAMVLRLGSSNGTGTQFTIVEAPSSLKDYFLFETETFTNPAMEFSPLLTKEQSLAFQLLQNLTEGSLVNFGFSSGLISSALELDSKTPIMTPATGQSTYTFDFKSHSDLPIILNHNKGQIEIDAIFIEKRNGIDTVFVLEAKTNTRYSTLAKHKLVYPILAIAPKVPMSLPIVPVYIKAYRKRNEYHFNVVECTFPDPRQRICALDELKTVNHKHLVIKFPNT